MTSHSNPGVRIRSSCQKEGAAARQQSRHLWHRNGNPSRGAWNRRDKASLDPDQETFGPTCNRPLFPRSVEDEASCADHFTSVRCHLRYHTAGLAVLSCSEDVTDSVDRTLAVLG